ncbi:MAG: hypothetical protein H6822_32845 [Planctomycetaceae bacterium]|nr:hypothetical protein [Planctomycetaceae bacterium]
MKFLVRLLTVVFLLVGGIALIHLSIDNRELGGQIDQLEAELGRMPIDNSDRVHLVEIETPEVPTEVASHVERVWQFRCYLPPGYDVIRFSGGGRVTKEGVYHAGGSSSGWGSARPEAIHQLLTVSFQKKDNRLVVFHTFGGSSGTTSWGDFDADRIDDTLVVQKIVSSGHGPRSFGQDTILPMLKIYDPSSAEDKEVAGEIITTYAGGMFMLCPKSRESSLNQLRRGETPVGFDPSWIATEAHDE